MTNWRNRIYTNIKNNMSIPILVVRQTKVAQVPSIYFEMIDNISIEADFSNEEVMQDMTIQLESYTSNITDGYKYHDTLQSIMSQMGFRKVSGVSVLANTSDTNIIRLVARYERKIGSGDNIKKI